MSSYAHQEVVWLDITMDEVLIVHILYSANHLGKQEHAPHHCTWI